jgi:hypothetical protein
MICKRGGVGPHRAGVGALMLLVQIVVFCAYLVALGVRLRRLLINAAWPQGLLGRGPLPAQRFANVAFQLLALKRKVSRFNSHPLPSPSSLFSPPFCVSLSFSFHFLPSFFSCVLLTCCDFNAKAETCMDSQRVAKMNLTFPIIILTLTEALWGSGWCNYNQSC